MGFKEEREAEREAFGSLVESIASGAWDEEKPEPIEEDPEPEPVYNSWPSKCLVFSKPNTHRFKGLKTQE